MAKLDLEKRLAELKAEHGDDGQKQVGKKPEAKAQPKKAAAKKKPPVRRRPTKTDKTTEQAQLFAYAYVRNGCNATAAYREIKPGVKDSTAQANGHRMLRNAKVQQFLAPLLEALMEKNQVDAEWVLARWREHADCSPLDYFYQTEDGDLHLRDIDSLNEIERRNLRSIDVTKTVSEGEDWSTTTYKWKITVVDQQKAVEMFAKYLDMLTRSLDEDEVERIGDLIEAGVKRIRASKDLDAWKDDAIEGTFSEVG